MYRLIIVLGLPRALDARVCVSPISTELSKVPELRFGSYNSMSIQ